MTCGARNRTLRDESGQALVFIVLAMFVLIGFTAFAVDAGRAWFTQRELQRSVDAAALAAAQDLPDIAAATATAEAYGPDTAAKNPLRLTDITEITVDPRCVTSIEGPCDPYNAVQIEGRAEVPTTFARIIGFDSMTVTAKATACSPCLGKKKLDIMMVLDRTGSMCQTSSGGNDPSCTDLENARSGIRTFLDLMDPTAHSVGLAVLPPSLNQSTRCQAPPSLAWYDNPGSQYLLVPLSSDYKLSNGSLNGGSSLVGTLDCIRGGGRTAYADAIDAAQRELDTNGRPDAEPVIIFLSDGAANYGPSFYPNSSPYRATPCHQGVTSAGFAKAGGTLVYSIGYDLNGSGTDYEQCHPAWWNGNQNQQLEQPPISSWDAIQGIATEPATFYNKPNPGDLSQIFEAIATDISARFARLIDDDAQ
ncbi:MAG TPA: pilus assembly protein TadG-related protein [Gaiellaceae bacterium]